MNRISEEFLKEGLALLEKYRAARLPLEARIRSDEEFLRLRHTPTGSAAASDMPSPASSWLFSSITGKHADMLERIPEPICLAREESDEPAAELLSKIIPVILDRCDFKRVYSELLYDKLKHGSGVYGVFWNPTLDSGLGDIELRRVELLNLYWEPGVSDIQDSENLFYVTSVSRAALEGRYPDAIRFEKPLGTLSCGDFEDGERVPVIDRYYKKYEGGKVKLCFVKFTPECLIYSSEEEGDESFYHHGRYPFVFDTLYREAGTPAGYGIISVTRGAQAYIDRLDENILEHSIMASKPRYMLKRNVGLDKNDFLDWNNPIIEVDGDLGEERVRAVDTPKLDTSILEVRGSKIDEIKEASYTRDINYGTAASNISSGVAIAALQEAGDKNSREIACESERAFADAVALMIELIRQFYDDGRIFRITAPNRREYVRFSKASVREQTFSLGGELMCRLPVFDIEVRASKSSPFTRASHNETLTELYRLGVFARENRDAALILLDSLELDGKGELIKQLKRAYPERESEVSDK